MIKKRVLVFGATGEIGGRIAKGAVEAGHHVVGVSRGQNKRPMPHLAGVEMVHGDKGDDAFIQGLASRFEVDVVIDSVSKLENIRAYQRHFKQVENFFICSSTGTFVPLQYFPGDEAHSWREETPVNFYTQSVRDACALDLWEKEQFPITIFRPTNIIGRGRVPLELWGGRNIEFYRTLKRSEPLTIPDCESVLVQSGFNDDLASAFVKALDHAEEVRGELFIISCKKAITLGRYLQVAMEVLGSRSEIRRVSPEIFLNNNPDASPKGLAFLLEPMCFDISKAEQMIGYQPTRTTEEGLQEALKWCAESGLLS